MKPVVLVVGAGDALGGAVARRFAREGYVAVVCRRHLDALQPLVQEISAAGGEAHAFSCDARREEQVTALFERVEREIGPIDVTVFNIGGNVRFKIVDTTAQKYFKVWEMCAFAGFLTGREAARAMTPRGNGTILFTGATASVRGGVGFAAFAGGKHALRALAQSMAQSTRLSRARIFALSSNRGRKVAYSRPTTSLKITGCFIGSHAAPGHLSWICAPGSNHGSSS